MSWLPATPARARALLLGIWFGGFVLNLAVVFYLYARGWIAQEWFQGGAKQLNDLYAPYLGAITLFYWSAGSGPAPTPSRRGSVGFGLAVAVSLLWNLALAALVVPLLWQGTIENAIDNMRGVVGLFSWLVAGAIGYYFGSPAGPVQRGAP